MRPVPSRFVLPAAVRPLVLAPHSDDDGLGLGAYLHQARPAGIVYLTDSAPRDPGFFTTPWPSREAYVAVRKEEARAAAGLLGIDAAALHFLDAVDMEAYRELGRLERDLARIAAAVRPDLIWSPAYEGGHPDHDVAAFLAARLGARLGAPCWEYALYRYEDGFRQFSFAGAGPAFAHRLHGEMAELKRRVVAAYASQRPMIDKLRLDLECYRPAPAYDFTRRPCSGPTLYEVWGWPVTAETVVGAFAALGPTEHPAR